MYNASLTFRNFGGGEVQRTVAPVAGKSRDRNLELVKQLLNGVTIDEGVLAATVDHSDVDFPALWCRLDPEPVLEFLSGYQWGPDHQGTLQLVIEFLQGKSGAPGIKDWLLVAPQPVKDQKGVVSFGEKSFKIRLRSRSLDGSRYLVYSEPDHILMARYLNGVVSGSPNNSATQALQSSERGVLLLYPVGTRHELDQKDPPSVGFVLAFPKNNIKRKVQFSVSDPSRPDAIIVDRPKKPK
jgi:hypothetical protein